MVAAGLLLAFEGIDGSGKSTQLALCADWLAQRCPQRACHVVREPGGTPMGEAVREILLHGPARDPLTEMLLYMAARAELFRQRVLPALEAGEVVLLDRSYYSTLAYQGAGLGLDSERILELARVATGGREPDRVVLLDLDASEAARRVPAGSGRDRIEDRGLEYFRRVGAAYRALAAEQPQRFAVVEAGAAMEVVARRVQEALSDVV